MLYQLSISVDTVIWTLIIVIIMVVVIMYKPLDTQCIYGCLFLSSCALEVRSINGSLSGIKVQFRFRYIFGANLFPLRLSLPGKSAPTRKFT